MRYLLLTLPLVLAGCGLNPFDRKVDTALPPPGPVEETPEAPLDATVDDSTETEAPAPSGEGTTVAGLGDPTREGLWMETPLVSSETTGRVTNPANGKWVRMTLLPSGGAAGSGSRLSPQAMQALDIPLTELATVQVSTSG